MLSEDLKCLFHFLDDFVDTGVELNGEVVFKLCSSLEAAIEDAKELESRTVPIPDQIAELPDNVVRIATLLDRKGVRAGCAPTGGDAA